MIRIYKAEERGKSNLGWLESRHSFSFGNYYDPKRTQFASLRVMNEDRVAPGAGFGKHSHDNMEIISYVLEGALAHKDSLGNGSVIYPGDVQRMSAGKGITHSEMNYNKDAEVHFLQIWFIPDKRDIEPGYEQKFFPQQDKKDRFLLVASKTGREGSISLHQDMDMSIAFIDGNKTLHYKALEGRVLWVQVAKGDVLMNGQPLQAGDGAAVEHVQTLCFEEAHQAEIIIFDMNALIKLV